MTAAQERSERCNCGARIRQVSRAYALICGADALSGEGTLPTDTTVPRPGKASLFL